MTKLKEMKPKAPKVLLYGKAGCGKTALCETVGSKGLLLDLDDGAITGMNLKDKHHSTRVEIEVEVFTEPSHDRAIAYRKFKDRLISLATEIKNKTCDKTVLIIDSLTALNDYCVRYVMKNSNKLGTNPEIQHWGVVFTEMDTILTIIRALPISVILCAHEANKTGEGGKVLNEITIAMTGNKMPSKIMRFFDEVWHMKAKPAAAGKVDYVIETVTTGIIECRTRYGMENMTKVDEGLPPLLKKMGYNI